MSERSIIVYGASGYTGELICEDLVRRGIPFIAAGRNQGRLDELVGRLGDDADVETRVVEHTAEGLRKMLEGTKVVVDTVGPFYTLGPAVVDAALDCGVHFIDTTGEQLYQREMRDQYGQRFADAKLVLNTSCAYFWGPGAALAEACLETEGVDSIEVIYMQENLQTVASLQSFLRMFRRKGVVKRDGQMVEATRGDVTAVDVPGLDHKRNAILLATGEPTWFIDDDRVRNIETRIVFQVAKTRSAAEVQAGLKSIIGVSDLGGAVLGDDRLENFMDWFVLQVKKDPPREDPESSGLLCVARGTGPNGESSYAEMRSHGPYLVTGFIAAEVAQRCVEGKAVRFGYVSCGQAVGHREMLGALEEGYGAKVKISSGAVAEAG